MPFPVCSGMGMRVSGWVFWLSPARWPQSLRRPSSVLALPLRPTMPSPPAAHGPAAEEEAQQAKRLRARRGLSEEDMRLLEEARRQSLAED